MRLVMDIWSTPCAPRKAADGAIRARWRPIFLDRCAISFKLETFPMQMFLT
jgi:hypothetical protein